MIGTRVLDNVVEIQPQELMAGLIAVIRETDKKIGYRKIKEMTETHLDAVMEETIRTKTKANKSQLSELEIHTIAAKLYTQVMIRSTMSALSALSDYYATAKTMKRSDFLKEGHSSTRIAKHMRATGIRRSPNVAAHAIVSGKHHGAHAARNILARHKIRIDDPDNGVFLPINDNYVPHPDMPDASNHAKIHTDDYYVNVFNLLSQVTSESDCRTALKHIATTLQAGEWSF